MKNRLSDTARLHHIVDAIAEIESYLIAVDMEVFINNSMMRFACIKQLEIIGEASNAITAEINQNLKRWSGERLWACGMFLFMSILA